jgi:hypothetical protein
MKPLEKNELFEHLHGFLKDKGVELKEGSYAQGIAKSCGLLTEAINLGQKGLGRAKEEMDKKLDQMRQVIHEKTAPKATAAATPPPAPPPAKTSSPRKKAAAKPPARTKASKRRARG